jgi:DNA-binding transcriptional LysR family regulator
MNEQHLRCIISVAKNKSISKASQELFISQPALSKTLEKIETQLGTPLFLRTTYGMELTPIGKEVLPMAQSMLKSIENHLDIIHSIVNARKSYITITFEYSFLMHFIPIDLSLRSGEYSVDFTISDGVKELQDQLREGMTDIGFCHRQTLESPDLNYIPIISESLFVLMNRGHPLSTFSELHISDLKGVPQLCPTVNGSNMPNIVGAFISEGFYPNYVFSSNDLDILIRNVRAGVGVYVASQHAATDDDIIAVPLIHENLSLELGFLVKPNCSDLIRGFIRTVQDRYQRV